MVFKHHAGLARIPGWIGLAATALLMGGCDTGVLGPRGPVGAAERLILLNATAIMLVVVVPVILMTIGFAWWFRASNARARYLPDWSYSGKLELIVWSIPTLAVLFLGGIAWVSSHDLDPQKPLESKVKPLVVEVVSLDWKWLFIYPDLHIASINTLTIPVGTPINFQLTSASVMNSFFIPQLGSQIYTMQGMVTRLNLEADTTGTYNGLSAQFSGDGFSDMVFTVNVVAADAFKHWQVQTVEQGPALRLTDYTKLATPSAKVAPQTFRDEAPTLFHTIVSAHADAQREQDAGRAKPVSMQPSPALSPPQSSPRPLTQAPSRPTEN